MHINTSLQLQLSCIPSVLTSFYLSDRFSACTLVCQVLSSNSIPVVKCRNDWSLAILCSLWQLQDWYYGRNSFRMQRAAKVRSGHPGACTCIIYTKRWCLSILIWFLFLQYWLCLHLIIPASDLTTCFVRFFFSNKYIVRKHQCLISPQTKSPPLWFIASQIL